MNRGQEYSRVLGLKPGRSVFDLSYAKKLSGRMGYLYPVLADEMVPGDVFDISAEAVIRFAPMVAPVLHEIVLKADWFFVPYRILQQRRENNTSGLTYWESWITGGYTGNDGTTRLDLGVLDLSVNPVPEGGLWDHLGVPPGVTLAQSKDLDSPLSFPGQAYLKIWNEYYRDPSFEAEVDPLACPSTMLCATANWDADYFTRALPFQQRGTAPALPVSGTTSAVWPIGDFAAPGSLAGHNLSTVAGAGAPPPYIGSDATGATAAQLKALFDNNTIDLSSATTFNVSDIRLAVQLQRWMERNARAGYRYTEFLRAHFGVAPRDDRLDRPEYIGGLRQPIVISEVLQTSKTETGAPQGNLAGHGILAGHHRIGRYHAQEYGIIMCIMSVIPRPAYQQGINRQWLRTSRYDFYHPEFANLSEQAVLNEEIYLDPSMANNRTTFGYQGRYDEMRSKRDMVSGAFRSTLNYWHLGRIFSGIPNLGSTFGHVDPTTVTRIFAVPSADHLYIHWGNRIKGIRPLPLQSNPGLMDHDYGGL